MAKHFDQNLVDQCREQEKLYNLRIKEELQKQEEYLNALFEEEMESVLRKERIDRVAQVRRLGTTIKQLEKISKQQATNEVSPFSFDFSLHFSPTSMFYLKNQTQIGSIPRDT